ncbi:hypothetical protein CP967_05615 [Streptomyces nitrosporeus]|uniref:DUF3558 domain-containing protein n=1 Tax=Streptomyces nitrosporeus TaxID=28894 RepID=A0A5J6F5C8_9ACTN|nr:hypothetical protein [Streptomyces nitrosporeus]QEU71509.1 hypothetical protein CP967_05615 [Streptomyces nitrosporeus]
MKDHGGADFLRGHGIPALVSLLLLTGCSGGTDEGSGPPGGAGREPSPSKAASPAPGADQSRGVLDADPARLPRDRAAARALIGRVAADPDSFGPGVVRRTPYESAPDTWPVLGADCVWRLAEPPDGVLATLTRSFEVPAEGGKGPLRLSAVVTVHRTADGARWEMARSLEESMRCPAQRLRRDERVDSLVSGVLFSGEGAQHTSDDSLTESGSYHATALGGPHPYLWQQAQSGPFTLAVTGKGAAGRTEPEISELLVHAIAAMLVRLEADVEKQD